jgi:hypothetical protein
MLLSVLFPSEKANENNFKILSEKDVQDPGLSSTSNFQEKNRLLFLIPSLVNNDIELCQYIKKIAQTSNSDILLLMLVSSYEDEAFGHIKLIDMTASLSGLQFKINSQIVLGNSWIDAIKQYIYPGDVIVCPKDLSVPVRIFSHEPLSKQLTRKLTEPIRTYSGFIIQKRSSPWNTVKKAIYWVGIIILLVGFFEVESTTSLNLTGWVGTFVMLLIAIVEIAGIYFWSVLLG